MRDKRMRIIAETGVAVALAVVLGFIRLWKMPQGGSVSLEMLPIFIIAFRWGGIPGMTAGMVYGLVQLAIDPYIIHPVQLVMDYPLPYMLLGIAGFVPLNKFKNTSSYIYLLGALLLGGLARFVTHLISGVVFFGHYAPEGQNPWVYSAIYNSSYILPSLLIAYFILIPLYRTLLVKNVD